MRRRAACRGIAIALVGGMPLWAACRDFGTPDRAGQIQAAVAIHMVEDVIRVPGELRGVCLGFAGSEVPRDLPDLRRDGLTTVDTEGCEEVEGQLRLREGGGLAMSIHVGMPEAMGGTRSRVGVLTSTGPVDVAAYRCEVAGRGAGWTVEGCQLEATS